MSPVPVAVTVPLEPELLAQIEAVDERIELLDASAPLEEAEVVLLGTQPRRLPDVLRDAVRANGSRVRWIHSIWAGAGEQVAAAELTREELERVAITTSAGVHATPLAEFALLGLLAFAKGLPRLLCAKADRRWDRYVMDELRDRTLLVLGVGSIGREVARLAGAFGMHTIGIKRTPGEVAHVDEVHPPERLRELLPHADAVVVTLPSTAATRWSTRRRSSRRSAWAGSGAPRSTSSPRSRCRPRARCGSFRTCCSRLTPRRARTTSSSGSSRSSATT